MSDLRVDLVVPVLRLGAGPFSFDPLEHFVGSKLCDLLEPVLAGPIAARRLPSGALVEVYPLRLPEGEGASIALGAWGELGFANAHGELVLTVPRATAAWVDSRLGAAVVDTRVIGGRVQYTVSLRPALRVGWSLGAHCEMALEIPDRNDES